MIDTECVICVCDGFVIVANPPPVLLTMALHHFKYSENDSLDNGYNSE